MPDSVSSSPKPCPSGCYRILGLDPAAAGPTGYGIIETDGRNSVALLYGAWKISKQKQKTASGTVLLELHELLCQLIRDYRPQAMAVENIFSALNIRTALRLAEVRGVVLLAAAEHGLPAYSYAPREIKASVTGNGSSDKRQVQAVVRALLSMSRLPEPADAADALAVALCHLQTEQFRRRFGLPGRNGVARSAKSNPPTPTFLTPPGKPIPGGSSRATRPALPRILLSR